MKARPSSSERSFSFFLCVSLHRGKSNSHRLNKETLRSTSITSFVLGTLVDRGGAKSGHGAELVHKLGALSAGNHHIHRQKAQTDLPPPPCWDEKEKNGSRNDCKPRCLHMNYTLAPSEGESATRSRREMTKVAISDSRSLPQPGANTTFMLLKSLKKH